MPLSLLSTKQDLNRFNNSIQASNEIQTIEDDNTEEYHWHELRILHHDQSLLTSLNRIGIYWREIIVNKIRSLLTLVFVTMFNITSRLPYFTHKNRSTSILPSAATLSPACTLEEELNHPSTSFIRFNTPLDLPSLNNTTMAHMLVQQPTHRTPNISLHTPKLTDDNSLLHMSRSLDDRLFFYQQYSNNFYNQPHRFASEPHMGGYHSTSNEFLYDPISTIFHPSNDVPEEQEEEVEVEGNPINCDAIQPVIIEECKSDTLDTITPATPTTELNEDILIHTNPLLNTDRHFRRRRRRSSLSLSSSISSDESEPIKTETDEDLTDNQSQEVSEKSQPVSIESLSLNETIEQKEDISEDNEEPKNITPAPSRLRGRRLRYRTYRHTPPACPEPTSPETVEFFLPCESLVAPPSPPISPVSPISPNILPGGLKRAGSNATTKKMVRFADSIGRELAQVQYIQSSPDDEMKESKLTKHNLYVPTTFNYEHKPWSFDVAQTAKQVPDTRIPKRFFCLYRQPNSEHPDIYLHEVWKSQIKLEYADIRLKPSIAGEQCLHGTVWVTNAGFWKNVTVKYSFNRWLNTYEYDAQHLCHSNDFRNIDQFEFNIDIPQDVDRIDFVLRYQVNGQEHWDNNESKNYTLETESASTPPTTISLPHDCDFNEMRFY